MHLYVFTSLLVFGLVSADTTDPRAEFKRVHEKCQSDPATHIDDTIFDKFKQGEQATDPNLPKHLLCIHEEQGIQSKNGDINVDKLRELMAREPGRDTEKVDEIISKCGTRTSANAEEAATGLSKCLLQYRPKHHDHHN